MSTPHGSSFAAVAQPGVVISNAWPESRREEGATLRAIEEVLARHSFFEVYQTVDIPHPAERRAVRRVLRDQGRHHTYALTRVLAERQLNLSALDAGQRRRAVEAVLAALDGAEEAGARTVALISGPRPAEPAARAEALAALEDSLAAIAAEVARRPGLELLIEPLDYEAHKRNTLGTTAEAVAICRRLAARRLPLALCLDTAHLILNEEDTLAAVAAAREFTAEFHFCNPVTDRASPLYGDRHIPFGEPGAIGVDEMARLMAGLRRDGYLSAAHRPRVYCEVIPTDGMAPSAVVAHCEETLRRAWARAQLPEH